VQVVVRVFIVKPELKPTVQERTLKAFLDIAILCALTEHSMTGYEINRLILKKHRILVNSGTIYAKLASMERKGWIKPAKIGARKVYELTEDGKRITVKMEDTTREIQAFLKNMLKCYDKANP
jgi:DNA-binding PadR family transcriptional regulator